MSSIDNKIVQMTFDNASFERKLEETLRSLEDLKKKLDFTNSSKNLGDLDAAAKHFDMGGMAERVGHVSKSFLALTTVALTALATITQRAVSAGINIVKSLSVEPILDGYKEYETNLNSIQTILANTSSKGSTLDDVNNALAQLNTYSDKTIYNFSQMARNIGTFTAAGVDLDTSVSAIKGIANLAAISGSNAEQASTAMYQLSQALASGSVKLMDWNSVVNAGMGGEVFQKALFETGKKLGTIKDVPIDQTFEQWTKAGNTFRGSLESGWITSQVLTDTLQGFTGDLTDAQLKAKGYTDEQIVQIQKLGKLGLDAATKVKTLSQLMGTIKEAVGSGWATTFQLIFGNFEQASTLFTAVGGAINGLVANSAKARNELFGLWNFLGGRDILIHGLVAAFAGLASIMKPIKEAFHNIFPPTTAFTLLALTKRFAEFAENLKIGGETARKIKDIFGGIFSVFRIGIEVVKELFKFFGELFHSVAGDGSGILDFFARIGTALVALKYALVDRGGIAKFFDKLAAAVKNPMAAIQKFKDFLSNLFSGGKIPGGEVAIGLFDRLTARFDNLKKFAQKVAAAFQWLGDRLEGVKNFLDVVWQGIKDWFSQLGDKLAAAMGPGDFNNVLDAVNVGLLGGIAALIGKWLKGGLNLDFGGVFKSITRSFDELTGVLKTLQTNIKADTLQKIAIAVGVLTASLVVLSLIDSAALTKALTATAVGFGQLVGAMALLDKVGDERSAAKLAVLGVGLILLAGAMVILSLAVKILSTMSWEELAKGISAVTALLGALSGVAVIISKNTGGMIRAGIGMIAMAGALLILSYAVKSFADLSWGDMLKGLAGVALGLGAVALAMNLMPASSVLSGAGFILVAVGLKILASAVGDFVGFKWGEIGKGLGAISIALVAIALAMNLMPLSLPITAAGLILVSIALGKIAKVIAEMASLSLGELVKGIGGLAAVLGVLAVGLTLMAGAIPGAIALGIAALSLNVFAKVLQEFAKIKTGDLIHGLIGVAAVFAVLGLAAFLLQPLIPALLGLGVALLALGAGFALFGVGASLVAKAFEILAKAGGAGIKVFLDLLDGIITRIPAFIKGIAQGLIDLAQTVLDASPPLVTAFGVLVEHILDTLIKLIPKFVKFLEDVIDAMIKVVGEKSGPLIEAGYQLLLNLLQGLQDHIGEITEMVSQIIINFLNALTAHAQELVEAGVNLILSILEGVATKLPDIVGAGLGLLVGFLKGITDNITLVVGAIGQLIAALVKAITDLASTIVTAGVDSLISFLSGITDNVVKVIAAIGTMIGQVIKAIGDLATKIAKAGTDALVSFLGGITGDIAKVTVAVGTLVTTFITELGKQALRIVQAGTKALVNFLAGIALSLPLVLVQGAKVAVAFIDGVLSAGLTIADGAAKAVIKFMHGLADAIRENSAGFRSAGVDIAAAIADGITGGLASKAASVAKSGANLAKAALKGIVGPAGFLINSPSKATYAVGLSVVEGLAMGMANDTPVVQAGQSLASTTVDAMQSTFSTISDQLGKMEEFAPTITPVLDLTGLQKDAKSITGLLPTAPLSTQLTLDQARQVSVSTTQPPPADQAPTEPTKPTEVSFVQNIHAPTELSANEIYRNTRSQIALAKEELRIP